MQEHAFARSLVTDREYMNLALFFLAGVILIFVMEQFIRIGQAMSLASR